jgi:hypothetical protein
MEVPRPIPTAPRMRLSHFPMTPPEFLTPPITAQTLALLFGSVCDAPTSPAEHVPDLIGIQSRRR